jgi:acetate kinase
MEGFGIALDTAKNETVIGREADISFSDAKVRTLVIPTNEELVIARDTERIVQTHK